MLSLTTSAIRVVPSSRTKQRACSSSWTYLAGGGVPKLPTSPSPSQGVILLVATPARNCFLTGDWAAAEAASKEIDIRIGSVTRHMITSAKVEVVRSRPCRRLGRRGDHFKFIELILSMGVRNTRTRQEDTCSAERCACPCTVANIILHPGCLRTNQLGNDRRG